MYGQDVKKDISTQDALLVRDGKGAALSYFNPFPIPVPFKKLNAARWVGENGKNSQTHPV